MICAVIPALDEEGAIGPVVAGLAPHVDRVIVIDNGSRDRTAEVAAAAGALVIPVAVRGYGAACLAGAARARELGAAVVLFLDGDGSDDPADAPRLVAPVREGHADLVLGVRTAVESGAMAPAQRLGNWLAPLAMRLFTGARYHDMPSYKAIRGDALEALALTDQGHGFTVQLMLEAHRRGLRALEVPVQHHVRRAGRSKVSGTLSGTVRAAAKILATIARHAAGGRRKNAWRSAASRSEP